MDGNLIHLMLACTTIIFKKEDLTEVCHSEVQKLDPFCESVDCCRADLSEDKSGYLISCQLYDESPPIKP